MKIKFNDRTQKNEFTIEDIDRANYHVVKRTMDTVGWKVICDIHAVAREEMIDTLKRYSRVRIKRDLCSNVASMIDGLDQFKLSVAKFMAKIEMMIEKEREESNDHGTSNNEDD